MQDKTVDVIIPVYKPDDKFEKLLKGLNSQTYPISHIIIMNTEERYWDEGYEELIEGLEVHHISKRQFDHGGTRRQGADLSRSHIMIYMTQDAIPYDKFMVENLVNAFETESIKAAYARQLPAYDCGELEKYTRNFNYPGYSYVNSLGSLATKGIKTYFCSNVCAAYDKETYEKLGGFVDKVIFNEDMIYGGTLIQAGYKIAYVSEARVIHSHNYNFNQQFHRNFDLGVSQAQHPEIFAEVSSEGEGVELVKKSARYVISIGKPYLLVNLLLQSTFKYLGFWCGKHYKMFPGKFISFATMNKEYWTF